MGLRFCKNWSCHFTLLLIGISVTYNLALGQATKPGPEQTHILSYDCRRAGAYCLNNKTCNENTGRCDCDVNQNYFCEDIATLPRGGANSIECVNGFFLKSSGSTPAECLCDEGYYGKACSVPRVDVECNKDNMTVYINPYGDFDGEIFVNDANLTVEDACTFQNVSEIYNDGVHKEGMALVIEHFSEECGNATFAQEYGNLNFTREFFIEYAKRVREATDQIITVSCEFTPSNRAVLNGSVTVTDSKSEINKIDIYKDTSVKVAFTVTEKGNNKTNAITLGQDIELTFSMETTEHSAYSDFIVTSCEVTNGKAGNNMSINIIQDECPTTEAHSLITKSLTTTGPVRPGKVSERMSMTAFVFLGESSSTLVFECIVDFCDRNCSHPTNPCSNTAVKAPFLRKRRSVENEQKVSAKITVVDPASQIKATSEMKTQDCLQEPSLIAIVSTLGGLVLLLLTLCIFLVLRLLKTRTKSLPHDDGARGVPMYELRIPRMSVQSANSNHY